MLSSIALNTTDVLVKLAQFISNEEIELIKINSEWNSSLIVIKYPVDSYIVGEDANSLTLAIFKERYSIAFTNSEGKYMLEEFTAFPLFASYVVSFVAAKVSSENARRIFKKRNKK